MCATRAICCGGSERSAAAAPNVRYSPVPCSGLCYDADVPSRTHADLIATLDHVSTPFPDLVMLVLYGSRARGDSHAHSDWDLAYQAKASFDPDALLAALAERLNADRIDLVDLDRAGALLRYRIARDAVVLVERDGGRFERFWLDAVGTWCDLAPVLEPLYARVLEALPR